MSYRALMEKVDMGGPEGGADRGGGPPEEGGGGREGDGGKW